MDIKEYTKDIQIREDYKEPEDLVLAKWSDGDEQEIAEVTVDMWFNIQKLAKTRRGKAAENLWQKSHGEA